MDKNCSTIKLGNLGESLAKAFLVKSGYTILACNYRNRVGEVDIIAKTGLTIAFVEVKTYKVYGLDSLEMVISAKKRRKIIHVAKSFLQDFAQDYEDVRFDVIFIDAADNRISHFADAFTG